MMDLAERVSDLAKTAPRVCGLCYFRDERWALCNCAASPHFNMRVEPGLRGCPCFRTQVPLSPFAASATCPAQQTNGEEN